MHPSTRSSQVLKFILLGWYVVFTYKIQKTNHQANYGCLTMGQRKLTL